MKYELKYYPMCGIDGDVDLQSGPRRREIEEEDDLRAVQVANRFLINNYKGTSTIPWYPQLWQGERCVATCKPEYPPEAHYLTWMLNLDRTPVKVISA